MKDIQEWTVAGCPELPFGTKLINAANHEFFVISNKPSIILNYKTQEFWLATNVNKFWKQITEDELPEDIYKSQMESIL